MSPLIPRQVTYQDWNVAYGEPDGEPYGEAEARRRQEAAEEYYVILGDPTSPEIVIQVEAERIGIIVTFLDDIRREKHMHFFEPGVLPEPDLLFLSQASTLLYTNPDPNYAATGGYTDYFNADGRHYTYRQIDNGPIDSTEGHLTPEEISELLIEPFPEFGDWASISRLDRDQPPQVDRPISGQVTYQDWNIPYREPDGEPYGEDEARRRHEEAEEYCVLLGDPTSPEIVIQVEAGRTGIMVTFLDELKREKHMHFFQPGLLPEPDLLFLSRTGTLLYTNPDPDDPATRRYSDYVFPDGSRYIFRLIDMDPMERTEGHLTPEEIKALRIEPYPEFGDWASISRLERDQPATS